MNFKVGDLVRVRNDLVVGSDYGNASFVDLMQEYEDKLYYIDSVDEYERVYKLRNCPDWDWTDRMLEEASPDDYINLFLEENKKVFKNFNVSFTVKPKILNEDEHRYLSSVIKPFRNKVTCICKESDSDYEYIAIQYEDDLFGSVTLYFPTFDTNAMYRGMETTVRYTLEDLDL